MTLKTRKEGDWPAVGCRRGIALLGGLAADHLGEDASWGQVLVGVETDCCPMGAEDCVTAARLAVRS